MNGFERIYVERERQLSEEGYTPRRDERYTSGELVRAAMCYEAGSPVGWPWEAMHWKPSDPCRNLEKAGALYLAEEARLIRSGDLGGGLRMVEKAQEMGHKIDALIQEGK